MCSYLALRVRRSVPTHPDYGPCYERADSIDGLSSSDTSCTAISLSLGTLLLEAVSFDRSDPQKNRALTRNQRSGHAEVFVVFALIRID
jgi:hypothetical protein